MNKNYIFVLAAISIVIVIIGVVVLYQSSSITLDQIIKNKDCTALSKWEEEHMFDNNLNVSSEQMSAAMKLATECVGKALKNMSGSSDSSNTLADQERASDLEYTLSNCWFIDSRLMSFIKEYGYTDLTEDETYAINSFVEECKRK